MIVSDLMLSKMIDSIELNVEEESSKILLFEDLIKCCDPEEVEAHLESSDALYTAFQNVFYSDIDELDESEIEE